MFTGRRVLRFAAAVFALAHVAGAPAFAVADAFLALSASPVVAHVEDATGDRCAPVHGADCVVCRALSATGGLAFSPAAVGVPDSVIEAGRLAARGESLLAGGAHLARAPPA
jgi:hypothetical protein